MVGRLGGAREEERGGGEEGEGRGGEGGERTETRGERPSFVSRAAWEMGRAGQLAPGVGRWGSEEPRALGCVQRRSGKAAGVLPFQLPPNRLPVLLCRASSSASTCATALCGKSMTASSESARVGSWSSPPCLSCCCSLASVGCCCAGALQPSCASFTGVRLVVLPAMAPMRTLLVPMQVYAQADGAGERQAKQGRCCCTHAAAAARALAGTPLPQALRFEACARRQFQPCCTSLPDPACPAACNRRSMSSACPRRASPKSQMTSR